MIVDDNGASRIKILEASVSQKIAAGEVVERPFSLVRELIDNSLDAHSKVIDVFIEQGGAARTRVVDDGVGMTQEDLALCFRRHATSKIASFDDLMQVQTLGFRGEALASIAACAKLEVTSLAAGQQHAHRVVVHAGEVMSLTDHPGKQGTIVDVADLFYNLPARRKFMKSTRSEMNACKAAFLDKAVAHPAVTFRLYVDRALQLFLPASDHVQRIQDAYKNSVPASMLEVVQADAEGLRLSILAARPGLARRDRKLLQIFVNRRRVQEYALAQAVQIGYGEYVPGGYRPVAFVFLDMDPGFVDFNVHPAKSEVRFRNLAYAHHAVTTALKDHLRSVMVRPPVAPASTQASATPQPVALDLSELGVERVAGELFASQEQLTRGETVETPRFLAQALGVFLLAEVGQRVIFVDQHAAHERVVFEALRKGLTLPEELLVSIEFETAPDEGAFIRGMLHELALLGICVRESSRNTFEITALAPELQTLEADEIVALLKSSTASVASLREDVLARIACKRAIKEGEELDRITAQRLLEEAYGLSNPRCPHGRPIWYEVSKKELFRAVGRDV